MTKCISYLRNVMSVFLETGPGNIYSECVLAISLHVYSMKSLKPKYDDLYLKATIRCNIQTPKHVRCFVCKLRHVLTAEEEIQTRKFVKQEAPNSDMQGKPGDGEV